MELENSNKKVVKSKSGKHFFDIQEERFDI